MMGMGNINPQDIGVFSDDKADVYYDKKTGKTLHVNFKKGMDIDVNPKSMNRSPNALTPPDYYDESGMPVHEFKKGLDITIPAPTPTPSPTPSRSPSSLGESADLKQLMGTLDKHNNLKMLDTALKTEKRINDASVDYINNHPERLTSKFNNEFNANQAHIQDMENKKRKLMQPEPMYSSEEQISAEDMEALKKILMGQGQMPSPTPAPAASPFRNIRGTIDRSK